MPTRAPTEHAGARNTSRRFRYRGSNPDHRGRSLRSGGSTFGGGCRGRDAGDRGRSGSLGLDRPVGGSGSLPRARGFNGRPGSTTGQIISLPTSSARQRARTRRHWWTRSPATLRRQWKWLADRHGLPFSLVDDFDYPGHSRRAHARSAVANGTGNWWITSAPAASATAVDILCNRRAETLFRDGRRRDRGRSRRPRGTRADRMPGADPRLQRIWRQPSDGPSATRPRSRTRCGSGMTATRAMPLHGAMNWVPHSGTWARIRATAMSRIHTAS